jgi:nucleotide-binding universal stress UspA family protein
VTLLHVVPESLGQRVMSTVRHESSGATLDAAAIDELDPNIVGIVGDVAVERTAVVGSVSKALATTYPDADLLVLGRHGAGERWHHTLGSVSRHCATHASMPVVLVPDDWERRLARHVTVGFDGSKNAAAAIAWAIDFAEDGTELHALLALDIAPWLPADVAQAQLKGELYQHETDLRARLDDADPLGRLRRDVVIGDARVALARAADRTDVLVIGARGAGMLGSTLLGSVSTWMLDAAGCPMVVVPGR